MPVPTDGGVWGEGDQVTDPKQGIKEFLEDNPNQAFTAGEVHEGTNESANKYESGEADTSGKEGTAESIHDMVSVDNVKIRLWELHAEGEADVRRVELDSGSKSFYGADEVVVWTGS